MHRAVRSKLMTGFVRSCKSLTGTAVQVWLGGGVHGSFTEGGLDLLKELQTYLRLNKAELQPKTKLAQPPGRSRCVLGLRGRFFWSDPQK